jgi:hypothetical protein
MALALSIVAGPVAVAAVTPPNVPANLQVPVGNAPFLVAHATGVQIYSCAVQGAGFAFRFVAPEATLADDAGQQIATHFAGPTWQATDGSSVKGMSVATAPSPSGTAIPWLLLRAVSTTTGTGGGTTLAATTFVQRVNTTGGVAPTSGCDAAHVGATARVDYTADYFFYTTPGLPKAGEPNVLPAVLALGGLAALLLGLALRDRRRQPA